MCGLKFGALLGEVCRGDGDEIVEIQAAVKGLEENVASGTLPDARNVQGRLSNDFEKQGIAKEEGDDIFFRSFGEKFCSLGCIE